MLVEKCQPFKNWWQMLFTHYALCWRLMREEGCGKFKKELCSLWYWTDDESIALLWPSKPIIRQHLMGIFCKHYTQCQVDRKYTKDIFKGLLKQIFLLWQNTPKRYVICKNRRIPAKTACETYTLISVAFVSADSFKFQESEEPRMGSNCPSLLGTYVQ